MIRQSKSRLELIRQSEAGECGLACVAMIAGHHGLKLDLGTLRRRFPQSARGSTIKTVLEVADELGLNGRAVRAEIEALGHLALPAMLHWDLNHFVVLERMVGVASAPGYMIVDPAGAGRTFSAAELSKHFTGVAVEFEPSVGFIRADLRPRLRLSQLWSRLSGLKSALSRVLALSFVCQIAVLATPFYMQLAIDSALPAGDVDLMNVLAVGFAGVLFINTVSSWVRARLLIELSNSLALQTAVNLFRQTIFLPMSWFERRHLGDIVSRFGSLQPITDLLSRGLVASIVDGALATTTFVLMAAFSPILTSLTVGVVLAYASLKIAFYRLMKLSNASVLSAQAVETSAFIENVRGVAAIKAFCQEGNRQRLWRNKKADVVNAMVRLGRLTSGFDAANSLIIGLESILFVYVAIRFAMEGRITLGTIFAYQAYKQSFVGAATRLIDQALSYRLMDVHLDRISDIAFAQVEPSTGGVRENAENQQPPKLELRDVSFQYGAGSPFVLRNVSLVLPVDRTIVFVGPSGSGKTTLFKILCGMLEPTSGAVLIDGVPLHDFGVRRFRSLIGVVSQEDTLFAGTLAENISFFDPDYHQEWINWCCDRAAIHNDIMAMPARYETQVGDMGSSLSGGQKQRILLARALYRRPKILFLDEGTAHLDVETEAKIAGGIGELAISRILVAHRPETMRAADVVFGVRGGSVVQLQRSVADQSATPQAMSSM